MPELPEVETVRLSLEKLYLNKKIESVEVLLSRMILSPLDDFKTIVTGSRFISFSRKGKYLFLNLDNGYTIVSHLRMEGKYIKVLKGEELPKHARVIFHLENDINMVYDDSRSFGIMILSKTEDVYSLKEIAKLGKEPFEIDDPKYLFDILQTKKTEIKSCLLDQEIMCGLGNIYCDEVLFKSKINPYRIANTLSIDECNLIIDNSKKTLEHALKLGGSTISSYHPEKGVDGRFQNELLCYGKKGESCPYCNKTLRKDELGGRGTTYCPSCQNVALRIGITGKIASGKSTVLNYFRNQGFKVFSSDEEVNRLYSLTSTKKGLINIFGEAVLNDNLTISKGYIKNTIVNDPQKKKELERFIHPLVKKSIIDFIHKYKEEKLVIIEVPLMFETKFNLLFDYIIGVTCSHSTQLSHLVNRGSKSVTTDLLINQSTKFDKNACKCDFLINNDGTLDELNKQLDSVTKKLLEHSH